MFPVPLWFSFIAKMKNIYFKVLKFYNPHARLVLVFIIDGWPVIGRKQSMNGKAWIQLWCCVIKKTLLAQLLYRHFIALHNITSRHVFNIHISTSKVCILLGASQQIRYGEQWINTRIQKFSQTKYRVNSMARHVWLYSSGIASL